MTGRHTPVVVLDRKAYARDRAPWLHARKAGIGGSDIAALAGLDDYRSPLSVYVDKTTPDLDDDGASEAAYWGGRLEDVVAREWQIRNPGVIRPAPGLLAHPDRVWQMATLDRLVAERRSTEPHAALEVKTSSLRADQHWQQDSPPPARVVAQVCWQLDVAGLDVAHVAALIGGQSYRQWIIERDDELTDELVDIADEFWHRHVVPRVPPAPTGHEADADALLALYPGDPDQEAVLDDDTLDALADLGQVKQELKTREALKRSLEDRVKAALGDRCRGLRDDGTLAVTWNPTSTKRLDSARFKAESPDIYEQFVTESTTRRLLPKPLKETA